MTEQLLHAEDVSASFQQMGRKSVSETVRGETFSSKRLREAIADDPLHLPDTEPPALPAQEDRPMPSPGRIRACVVRTGNI
jgi:hypothetical protein